MLKEIGSNFWLPQGPKNRTTIDGRLFNVDFADSVFTSSGRSAISYVLSSLSDERRRVLLPSFTCESVIEPFLKNGYQISFYSVDKALCIDKERFLDEATAGNSSVILIHNYFGFDTTESIRDALDELRHNGTVVIEDITQTLYSTFPRLPADYYIGSFRKWDGIPDGGFALKVNGAFAEKPEREDEQLATAKVNAMQAKYNYIFHDIGEKTAFLKMYADAEGLLEKQDAVYRMSEVAYREQANLDVQKLKDRRRGNFLFLLGNFGTSKIKPVFSCLPDNVVPLYFPVVCEGNRTSLQSWLRTNQIFAPVVWPKPDSIMNAMDEANYFYDNLLCIPCDQRYGTEEMGKIANCAKAFSGKGV